MVKASINGAMAATTGALGPITISMVLGSMPGKMEDAMKGIGKWARCMARAHTFGRTGGGMKDSISKIRSMGKGNIFGRMGRDSRARGSMAKEKEEALSHILTEMSRLENGKTMSESSGYRHRKGKIIF